MILGYSRKRPVGAFSTPEGRLTLTSGTPVMTSTVSAATTVYYTPYIGNQVPLWNGSIFTLTTFAELSQATTDTTKSPDATAANKQYDLFVWNDSGTIRCTRGPFWSTSASRGTGAGTTELERVAGVFLNKVDITNGPAANRGTYVGTISTGAGNTVDWTYAGINTAGGLAVWNMYNRVAVGTFYASAADANVVGPGLVNAATNSSLGFTCGAAEDAVAFEAFGVSNGGGAAGAMIEYDLSGVISGLSATEGTSAQASASSSFYARTDLGVHSIRFDWGVQTGVATVYGDAGVPAFIQSGAAMRLMM